MAQFYATMKGAKGEASRLGSKQSGINVSVKSWEGEVDVRMWHSDGRDWVCVTLGAHGGGRSITLYRGACDEWNTKPVGADALANAVWDASHGRTPEFAT